MPNAFEEKRLPAFDSMNFYGQIICSHITELDVVVFYISHGRSKSFVQVIHFHVNEDDDKLTYSSNYSFVPKELRLLRDFYLGQKDKGEIILFGGFSDSVISECYDSRRREIINNFVWDGTLSVDGRDVIWKATNHVLPEVEFGYPTMFYFNDNIYIVENVGCDSDTDMLQHE